MPAPISRDKGLLYPPFAAILRQFEDRLAAALLPFHVFEAFRTFDRSDELYAQGRTTPGRIVTNARGGDSWHNYGLAADYVLDGTIEQPGIQWSWNLRADLNADGRNDWQQMAEIARECGLEAAWFWLRFPEAPHVQRRYGLELGEAKELYRQGGIPRVWASLSAA